MKLPQSQYRLGWKYRLKCWWRLKTSKCEWCHGQLRKDYDSGYGGIDIMSGNRKITYYVCNLCYNFWHKK